ncbi:MAG: hypothetical protein II204_04220 [Alistipes sp.]|nr:hypothetical protein [Alistipes sp.]
MKKVLFLVAAMFALALPAANAQKVATAKELAKLEKADATVLDAKKGLKASSWVARANAYANAYILPTKELGQGIPAQVLQMNVGNPEGSYESTFQGMPSIVFSYEYVDVYLDPATGFIQGWEQKLAIKENLAETAIESMAKAYEMDPKQESKIASIALTLSNALAQQGDALNNMGHTAEAAQSFLTAFQALTVVPSTTPNFDYLYNAGMLMTMYASTLQGDEAVAAFNAGEQLFNTALASGYEDAVGNIYYFLFHCYYGQKEVNRDAALANAKEALLAGIKKFPKNNTILDGLMQLYTAEEGVGDPAELVTMIENSLNEDPSNYDLWFGRGRVFNALKNYDECIKSFEKCVELRPTDFEPNFYTGYFVIEKANAQVEALNSNSNLSYEQYEAEYAKINNIYAEAIPWLERAHELNPTDGATIEYLNNLCFRLRDMDGMMEKYNKYHELFMNL